MYTESPGPSTVLSPSMYCVTRPAVIVIISSWSGCLWKAWKYPGSSRTSITTNDVQPVPGGAQRIPALPHSKRLHRHLVAQHEPAHAAPPPVEMALNRFMFSVIAVSVGSRSMLEAPKKPTTPVVRSST